MNHVLVNGGTTVEIEPEYGRIVAVSSGKHGHQLIQEPSLAENFRLLVPLPELRGHYVRGADQRLSAATRAGDAELVLQWTQLRSAQGTFDITVETRVRVDGDGDVHFQTHVDNASGHPVEEVHNVVLGGLNVPAEQRREWRIHFAGHVGQGREWTFFDEFPGSYLGPELPVWIGGYLGDLSLPWIDLYHSSGGYGVYFGNHDEHSRQSYLFTELNPCTTYRGGPSESAQFWPDRSLTGDTPVGLAMSWANVPFVETGADWQGPDVVLHFHDGDWWRAARYFRSWYDSVVPMPPARSWLADEDAWQSTIISYPDDTIGYRFDQIPELARAAADVGVKVLQLDGWDVGGIDRDYPTYQPDLRLGSWQDLAEAIVECHRLGVRVLLFANLQWINIETDWYRDELSRYACRDPYGNIRGGMGWQYRTILGLKNQTIHRMVQANCSRPEFQEVILHELQNVVALGADGTQLDKVGVAFDFDYSPDNPMPRDVAGQQGLLSTLDRFVERARSVNPDFAVASEVHWDRVMPAIDASYSRFFSTDHLPTFAATFPEYRQSCCVTGRWDFGLVNNCLRFGHIINLEGDCLHGSARSMPELTPYVREALALRRRLRHRIWDSRLVDPADLAAGLPDRVYLSLHESLADGTRTAVLNHFERSPRQATLDPGDRETRAVIHRPFSEPEPVDLPATVTIPPDQVVVVELLTS